MLNIDAVLHDFQSWSCCHTKRGANKAAHLLAKEGILHGIDRVWLNFIPGFIFNIVNTEKMSLVF